MMVKTYGIRPSFTYWTVKGPHEFQGYVKKEITGVLLRFLALEVTWMKGVDGMDSTVGRMRQS